MNKDEVTLVINNFQTVVLIKEKWSQEKAARRIGVSQCYLSMILGRKKVPSEDVLAKMALLTITKGKLVAN